MALSFYQKSDMKQTYKIIKLDKRFQGYKMYTYAICFNNIRSFTDFPARRANFDNCRKWCWETFGAGCELELAYEGLATNGWSWRFDPKLPTMRIFLKSEYLSHFVLAFPS